MARKVFVQTDKKETDTQSTSTSGVKKVLSKERGLTPAWNLSAARLTLGL